MEINWFDEKYTGRAAELLAEQFSWWLKAFSLLPVRIADRDVARGVLVDLFAKKEIHKEKSNSPVVFNRQGNLINSFAVSFC